MKTNEIIAALRYCQLSQHTDCWGCPANIGDSSCLDVLHKDAADALEAQQKRIEELEAERRWIPVTEGLPDLIPCGAGTAYSEAVNVLTSGRKVLTAIWDGFDWTCDAEYWDAEDEEITHWTPVLLPLPEPPKEV